MEAHEYKELDNHEPSSSYDSVLSIIEQTKSYWEFHQLYKSLRKYDMGKHVTAKKFCCCEG